MNRDILKSGLLTMFILLVLGVVGYALAEYRETFKDRAEAINESSSENRTDVVDTINNSQTPEQDENAEITFITYEVGDVFIDVEKLFGPPVGYPSSQRFEKELIVHGTVTIRPTDTNCVTEPCPEASNMDPEFFLDDSAGRIGAGPGKNRLYSIRMEDTPGVTHTILQSLTVGKNYTLGGTLTLFDERAVNGQFTFSFRPTRLY